MKLLTRIQNCPNRFFALFIFIWWTALCIFYLRQFPEADPVPIPLRRPIENYSLEDRNLLEQQKCVRNTAPCPRLKLTRTNDHLIDFPNFRYLLDIEPCDGTESLVVLVHSAPKHCAERESIRSTWTQGSGRLRGFKIKPVFLLATTADPEGNAMIEREHKRYRDIVQGNFIDSYHNLTYKHVMGLKWVWEKCNRVPHILKMDDDIFVHLFNLHKLITELKSKQSSEDQLVCYVQKQMPVTRDEGSKWQVKVPEYPLMFYEDYCSGWAYLMSPDVARRLYLESKYRPYFWVDDVHVTGTLAKMAGVHRLAINSKFTTAAESITTWLKYDNGKEWKYIFGPTWGDSDLIAKAHSRAKECQRKQCTCCFEMFTIQIEETRETQNSPRKGRAQIVSVN